MQNSNLMEKEEQNAKNLLSYVKIGHEILTFNNIEIEKQ